MATEMKLITDITLELTGETKRYEVVAKQGDKATRFIRITLKNNGQDFEIPAGMKVIANIQKPDRKCCYNTCSYSGSTVTMELTNQALAVAGTAECDIEIRDANDEVVLSSQAFTIEIEKSMRDENAIKSSNEFTELDGKFKGYLEDIKTAKEDIERIDTEIREEIPKNTQLYVNEYLQENPIQVGSITEVNKEIETLEDATFKVTNVLYSQEDVVMGSYYDAATGELKTTTSNTASAMSPMIPAIPGAIIKLPQKVDITYFDKNLKYISGVKGNDVSVQKITVLETAVWYVLSTSTWGSNFKSGLHGYVIVYTDKYAKAWNYEIPDLGISWENVKGKEEVDQAVEEVAALKETYENSKESIETARKLTKVFDIRKAIINGTETFYDGFYAGYPYDASTERADITLYDETMNFINVLDASGTPVNRTDIGAWSAAKRDVIYFDGLNVTVETYVSMEEWNNRKPHAVSRYTLSGVPKYIKTNRSYNFVSISEVAEDYMWIKLDTKNHFGILEQIEDYVQTRLEERIDGDIGKKIKCMSIRETNKTRDAIRIGTYNIYGAGHGQSNWECVKEQMQDFGIEICAFQEVKSPNGNLDSTNTKIFADEMTGWQFPYCSDNGDLYPTNERMLLSALEITDSSEFEFENWSSDRRCLAKYEVKLPLFKDRVGSDQIKMSIYNTQLEVYPGTGNATNRILETQQILDEISKDKNPFIVVCMDSNDFSPDKEIWKMFIDAGFTYAISIESQTVRDQNNCIDQIFVCENMEVLNYDSINSNLYKFYKNGMTAVSDHNLCFADIKLKYENFCCIKQSLTNVSSDCSEVTIKKGEALTINVLADNGHTIEKVIVRMGANDVTASVYTEGIITIPEVTGDIYIIASAETDE